MNLLVHSFKEELL